MFQSRLRTQSVKNCACIQISVNCYDFSNGRIIFVFLLQISVFYQIFAIVKQLEYPRIASVGRLCLILILQLKFQRQYFCLFSVGKIRSCLSVGKRLLYMQIHEPIFS
jgi:hypothetical protein